MGVSPIKTRGCSGAERTPLGDNLSPPEHTCEGKNIQKKWQVFLTLVRVYGYVIYTRNMDYGIMPTKNVFIDIIIVFLEVYYITAFKYYDDTEITEILKNYENQLDELM